MYDNGPQSGTVRERDYCEISGLLYISEMGKTTHFKFCTACLLIKSAHKVRVAQVM